MRLLRYALCLVAPEGESLAVETVISRVTQLAADHVVLTGGEPMLFAELVPLAAELRRLKRHITIETAGTRFQPVECDLMSISPKLSNSTPSWGENPDWARRHEQTRHAPDVIRRLVASYCYQFKFVVESLAACQEVERYLADFPEIDRSRVMLMPEGTELSVLAERAVWLTRYCEDRRWPIALDGTSSGLGLCVEPERWTGYVGGAEPSESHHTSLRRNAL